ncbi:AI-2E family transporter [Cupriavidus lacunae]|uniref:AI-2E family transporter n=1 Tax=Cupriavidus lacunae TaxID=2666307 RepID=A0A370NPX1_9BURK|nr:AI-2E family transporter [Cupriavidus lacunae]RDK07655.1 AI-2E family transporter [Cupriavidus lacunae]
MPQVRFTIPTLSRTLIDIFIRFGLISLLAVSCFQIFKPFMSLILWSMILAITLYPLQTRLRGKVFDSEGRTATLIVFLVICVILVPSCMLGVALIDSVEHAMDIARSGRFQIPPPAESVMGWPLIGQRLYDFWMLAATDFTSLAEKLAPQIKIVVVALLGTARGVGVGLLIFVAALIVAGIFMAYGELGTRSAIQIASRISGPERGPRITALCTATVRAVAQGVVGIAFIQMLLIGIAFVVKAVPGAGLLALAVLLLGIMQLPATLITIPVILFVFATESVSVSSVVFAIYVFIAGLADNVLKPMLLGRGVDVPMPVVLIGALGGMVSGGVIGLFIGPVVLAVGYQLFWQWVEDAQQAVEGVEAIETVEIAEPTGTEARSDTRPAGG